MFKWILAFLLPFYFTATVFGDDSPQTREQLEHLYQSSRALIASLPLNSEMSGISWTGFKRLIKEQSRSSEKYANSLGNAELWIDYLQRYPDLLGTLFDFPYVLQTESGEVPSVYTRYNGALVTPGMASMIEHCKIHFEKTVASWTFHTEAGYQSPAFQAYLLAREKGALSQVLKHTPPPYYSRHQRPVPDLKVRLEPEADEDDLQSVWRKLESICEPFGFSLDPDQINGFQAELQFPGIRGLYEPILSNELIPAQLVVDFEEAMNRALFYPSPQGLRTIFALSAQESTIQWNPRLNLSKKAYLKERFYQTFSHINSGFGDRFSNLFLSRDFQQQKRELIKELERITDPQQERIREYDVYVWTRKTHRFLKKIMADYKKIGQIGQWFFELESLTEQLYFEPQTFGLWQINVNHLIERLNENPKLRRGFPELFYRNQGRMIVGRHWLVDALSGVATSPLSRSKTIELIVRTYLKPRYENHLHGEKEDMLFFIAENMGGEMSSYRTAVQYELNRYLGSSLNLDGDLTFYRPHSIKIDWFRKSDSYLKIVDYLGINAEWFSKQANPNQLIRDLCAASSWDQLKQSDLYLHIMRDAQHIRRYPEIKSELYRQTPRRYARQVIKKAQLFR